MKYVYPSVGNDPEMFIIEGDKVIPAEKIITNNRGNSSYRHWLDAEYKVKVDNAAVELNFPAHTCLQSGISGMAMTLKKLKETYLQSKDYGISQASFAVSNLSDATKSSIPMAPKPKHEAFEDIYLGSPQEREKLTYSLANSLSKIKPDDSLILFREKALQNNFDDKAFSQALHIALNTGRLKLSDFQLQEQNKLAIPQRLDLDSILKGNRNFFDLFKGKQ